MLLEWYVRNCIIGATQMASIGWNKDKDLQMFHVSRNTVFFKKLFYILFLKAFINKNLVG